MSKNLKKEQVNYNREKFNKVVKEWYVSKGSQYLLRYPTVYILNDTNDKNNYEVYVGETNNIKYRTKQHLIKGESEWLDLSNSDTSSCML
ncbi:GIY-YIG nuclease family protein [Staphylococcus gallinarum]